MSKKRARRQTTFVLQVCPSGKEDDWEDLQLGSAIHKGTLQNAALSLDNIGVMARVVRRVTTDFLCEED